MFEVFAFEEEERYQMDDQVHLVDRLGSHDKLRETLLIATDSRMEIGTGLIFKLVQNCLLDNFSCDYLVHSFSIQVKIYMIINTERI